ncbi:MAG: molybdopterin molybdotransferase MoeA [Methanotrichaceae archaeon]|nr:molybdopterin molybdotransferase MoeA [Methanotrichaceae archaeon]
MFKRLVSAKEAEKALLGICGPILRTESLNLSSCRDRVLSSDIISPADLPPFCRAAMDGYAVVAARTRGASSNSPIYLDDARRIRTGQAVEEPHDAVVMLEDAVLRAGLLEVSAEAHRFKNVSQVGEDIKKGEVVLSRGHRLRPPDIALLTALGLQSVQVYERPRVAVIPTGGELVKPGSRPLLPGEAYEINSIMARLYLELWGASADRDEIVPDDPESIRRAIEGRRDADLILLIGGTSVGERDFAPQVLADAGELLVHGVRIQPGKPTAVGTVGKRPVVCLPGYPVAALAALYLLVRPAVKIMAHLDGRPPVTSARLSQKVASRPGYLSIVRVALNHGQAAPIMTTGAGILSSVARADGFVAVPEEIEGLEAGEVVEVNLFE